MNALTDFFALRPMVTLTFLRAVWYAYILVQGGSLFWAVWGSRYINFGWSEVLSVGWLALFPILNILLARVLLEAAGAILLGRAAKTASQA